MRIGLSCYKISQMEAFNRNNKTEILLLFEYQKLWGVKTIGEAGLSLETEVDVDLDFAPESVTLPYTAPLSV